MIYSAAETLTSSSSPSSFSYSKCSSKVPYITKSLIRVVSSSSIFKSAFFLVPLGSLNTTCIGSGALAGVFPVRNCSILLIISCSSIPKILEELWAYTVLEIVSGIKATVAAISLINSARFTGSSLASSNSREHLNSIKSFA